MEKKENKFKGGRPFLKDQADKKTSYLSVRVSKKELEDFTKTAEYYNCKPSEFLRNLVYKELGVFVKTKPNLDVQQTRTEIRRIGINLNQIVVKAHHNNLSEEMILKLNDTLKIIENKLLEL